MAFGIIDGRWVYGPFPFQDHHGDGTPLSLTGHQESEIERLFGVAAVIRYYDRFGIWVGPPCTRPCRYALARTRPIPPDRHTASDRRGPFALRGTSRLTRYNMSDRRGLTRHVGYFHGGCSGEAPVTLAGGLLMVGGSCEVHYPRSPDHQQPSRKCRRTSARPAMGTSVAAGSPAAAPLALP